MTKKKAKFSKKVLIDEVKSLVKNLPLYRVEVSYTAGDKDQLLEDLADSCKGELLGSGAGFGVRDLSFGFNQDIDARKFVAKVKKTKQRVKINNVFKLVVDYNYVVLHG